MQVQCSDCGTYKPEREVKLGICDSCFNYGAPNQRGTVDTKKAADALFDAQVANIILTTSIDVPNRKIQSIVSIVAAESALGMNILRDIANSWRDVVGGRAVSSEKTLRDARLSCLQELKREAAAVGADAVIAVDLDYSELSTNAGAGILFVAANGTAVKLEPVDKVMPA